MAKHILKYVGHFTRLCVKGLKILRIVLQKRIRFFHGPFLEIYAIVIKCVSILSQKSTTIYCKIVANMQALNFWLFDAWPYLNICALHL